MMISLRNLLTLFSLLSLWLISAAGKQTDVYSAEEKVSVIISWAEPKSAGDVSVKASVMSSLSAMEGVKMDEPFTIIPAVRADVPRSKIAEIQKIPGVVDVEHDGKVYAYSKESKRIKTKLENANIYMNGIHN